MSSGPPDDSPTQRRKPRDSIAQLTPTKLSVADTDRRTQELQAATKAAQTFYGPLYQIAIITLVHVEHVPVDTLADTVEDLGGSSNSGPGAHLSYLVAQFPALVAQFPAAHSEGNEKHYTIWHRMVNSGTAAAASVVADMLTLFPELTHIFVVGTGIGIPSLLDPDTDTHLGDIVTSRHGIYEEGFIQLRNGSHNYAGTPVEPADELKSVLDGPQIAFAPGKAPWQESTDASTVPGFQRPDDSTDLLYDAENPGQPVSRPSCPTRVSGYPLVIQGKVGSGDTLYNDPAYGVPVARSLGLQAIDMETASVTRAVRESGRRIDTLAIRGASDYGNSQVRQRWGRYAALVAASYLRTVLGKMPAKRASGGGDDGGRASTESP